MEFKTEKLHESIYLIYPTVCRDNGLKVYKIGRSSQPATKRVGQYPSGSQLLLQIHCYDSKTCERDLINLFKRKYKQYHLGHEYFDGNYIEMMNDIFTYVKNHQSNDGQNDLKNPISTTSLEYLSQCKEIICRTKYDNYVTGEQLFYSSPRLFRKDILRSVVTWQATHSDIKEKWNELAEQVNCKSNLNQIK